MPRTTSFAVGDHVEWNSEAGRVRGTIIRVRPKDFDYKGHTHRASNDQPQYVIKSDTTDQMAMHKESALRKIRKSAGRGRKSRKSRR